FSEPDRLSPARLVENGEDFDAIFAQSLAAGPTIVSLARNARVDVSDVLAKSGLALAGADPLAHVPDLGGAAQPLPILADAARGIGVASLDGAGAGIARRLPLLWRNGDAVLPTLAVESLRVALGVSTLVVIGDDAGMVEQLRIGDLA